MAMSRKHYRQAAEILNAQALRGEATTPEDRVRVEIVTQVADGLARMFARDNSAFSRQQFMDAVFSGK